MFLTLVLDVGEWSASCPSYFILRERATNTHLTGVWLSCRGSLDVVAKRKNPCPCFELNPDHPACSSVTMLTELLLVVGFILMGIIHKGY
jgi:hypothetical protein